MIWPKSKSVRCISNGKIYRFFEIFSLLLFLAFDIEYQAALASSMDPPRDHEQEIKSLSRISRAVSGSPVNAESFEHILIDSRTWRGGSGDIAAAYNTALDLLGRMQYRGRMTILGDDKSIEILSNLTGEQVQSRTSFSNKRINFLHEVDLSKEITPVDLYIRVASPSGAFDSESFVFKMGTWDDVVRRHLPKGSGDQAVSGIPLKKNSVLISQPVLGNTENGHTIDPFAHGRANGVEFEMQAAGAGVGEAGIYVDPVARMLRGKLKEQVRDFVLKGSADIPSSEAKNVISSIVSGQKLQGAKMGVAYGLSHTDIRDFDDYLDGLAKSAKRKRRSYVIMTPDTYDSPRSESIEVVRLGEPLPRRPVSGKVYVVQTGVVPNNVFVGLMGLSELPLVLSGDGMLSAAINLGKPFWMAKLEWNEKNIREVGALLDSAPLSAEHQALLDRIFNSKHSPRGRRRPETMIDASEAFRLLDSPVLDAYRSLQKKTRPLTDSIIEAAQAIRAFSEGKTAGLALLSQIRDPILRRSVLLRLAEKGDASAVRSLIELFRREPLNMAYTVLRGRVPRSLLALESIRSIIENSWTLEADKVIAHAVVNIMQTLGDERAKNVLIDKSLRYGSDGIFFYESTPSLDVFKQTVGGQALDVLKAIEPRLATDPAIMRTIVENAHPNVIGALSSKFESFSIARDSPVFAQLGRLLLSPDPNLRDHAHAAIGKNFKTPISEELAGYIREGLKRNGLDEGYCFLLGKVPPQGPEISELLLRALVEGTIPRKHSISLIRAIINQDPTNPVAREVSRTFHERGIELSQSIARKFLDTISSPDSPATTHCLGQVPILQE